MKSRWLHIIIGLLLTLVPCEAAAISNATETIDRSPVWQQATKNLTKFVFGGVLLSSLVLLLFLMGRALRSDFNSTAHREVPPNLITEGDDAAAITFGARVDLSTARSISQPPQPPLMEEDFHTDLLREKYVQDMLPDANRSNKKRRTRHQHEKEEEAERKKMYRAKAGEESKKK